MRVEKLELRYGRRGGWAHQEGEDGAATTVIFGKRGFLGKLTAVRSACACVYACERVCVVCRSYEHLPR